MPNAYAQPLNLTCAWCGKASTADVYLIVDIAERPDLREKILNGSLQYIPCPHCAHLELVDMPLLIFRPDKVPHILFSPAQRTSQAEDLQQAIDLGAQLKISLAAAWQDDWLNDGLTVVQRYLLPSAVSDDPETDKKQQDGQHAMQPHLSDSLEEIVEELNRSVQSSDIPHRIALCRKALERVSIETQKNLWGGLQGTLAENLMQNPTGKRAENIEQAIYHYQQALDVFTRQAFPKDWAKTMGNLGIAYNDRIWGERAENLEQAIHYFQQALEVYTREAFPQIWASIINNLAIAYDERIRGDRGKNIEQAIHLYQQVLEVYTRQAHPESWAMCQSNLAIAYLNRIRGERSENIEQAIHLYQKPLEVYTRESFPADWGRIQNNLATAYIERIRGDRTENLEQAIYHSQQALEVYTGQVDPQRLAAIQNNLAVAYANRIRGNRAENLEQAIYLYQQVLEVYTRQAFPQDWAQAQLNLANAYRTREHGDRAENLERAIDHNLQSLEVYTRQAFPENWAGTQNNLAVVYTERLRGERAENIERAIHCYQQVLEVHTRLANPEHWARTQTNLANAYSARNQGDRAQNIKLAIHHYQQALEVYTREAFPDNCCRTAQALGNLAFDTQYWELARNAYTEALAAQDVLMQISFTRSGKQAVLQEMKVVPSRAAYAYIQLGELERGVEVLEQGCAQLLRESIERQRSDLEELPASGFKSLYLDYMLAIRHYNDLQNMEMIESIRPGDWSLRMESALRRVQTAAIAIREEAGQTYPQYRYFQQTLPFAEIQKQAEERPLVYLASTRAGGFALVVTEQGIRSFELPKMNRASLNMRGWRSEATERVNDHLNQGKLTLEDIQAVRGGYLSMYILWRLAGGLHNTPEDLKTQLFLAWQETLDETTRWLWDIVMGELIAALKRQYTSLTLIAMGGLALFPLHAAWTEDASQPSGRRYALDDLCITYAPSAHALRQARLASKRPTESLMAVDNPDGTLFFSEGEVQAALGVFQQVKHLAGGQAKVELVKKEMQQAHVLHFSTHGMVGWGETEDARLQLADGDLTLRDTFALKLYKTRLAVLSACETGVPGLGLVDEMVGLPSGLVQAGVPGVIGSLWSVNDMSTAMLMARFYSLWRDHGYSLPEALRQAQIWLRNSTTAEKKELFGHFMERQTVRISTDAAKAFYQHIGWDDPDARVFASPYYWAAFTYTGV